MKKVLHTKCEGNLTFVTSLSIFIQFIVCSWFTGASCFLSILVRRFLQFSHSFSDPSKQFLNIICRTGLLTFLHPDLVNTSAIITKTFQFFPRRKKVGSAFRCILLYLLKKACSGPQRFDLTSAGKTAPNSQRMDRIF